LVRGIREVANGKHAFSAARGRVKRQTTRFRIYVFGAVGNVIDKPRGCPLPPTTQFIVKLRMNSPQAAWDSIRPGGW